MPFAGGDRLAPDADGASIPRTTLSSFPAKIPIHIIEDVCKQDLKQPRPTRTKWELSGLCALRLTDKFFNAIATPFLFVSVTINDDEVEDALVRYVIIPRFPSAFAYAGFGRRHPHHDDESHKFSWARGHAAVAQLLVLPNLRNLVVGGNRDVRAFQLLGVVPTPADALEKDAYDVSWNNAELVGWSRATFREVAGRVAALEMRVLGPGQTRGERGGDSRDVPKSRDVLAALAWIAYVDVAPSRRRSTRLPHHAQRRRLGHRPRVDGGRHHVHGPSQIHLGLSHIQNVEPRRCFPDIYRQVRADGRKLRALSIRRPSVRVRPLGHLPPPHKPHSLRP